MPISLDEDTFGADLTEIFLLNIIICGAVLIRLNAGGFVIMHFTLHTTSAEIAAAANHAAAHLISATGIHNLVFFVSKDDWGDDKVAAESLVLQTAFGVVPTLMAKSKNLAGQSSLDLSIHMPAGAHSPSWMGIRSHRDGSTRVLPINASMFRINRSTMPPSVVVAPLQTLPTNRDGFQAI